MIRSKKAKEIKKEIEEAIDKLKNEWGNIREDKPNKPRKPRNKPSEPIDIPIVESKNNVTVKKKKV